MNNVDYLQEKCKLDNLKMLKKISVRYMSLLDDCSTYNFEDMNIINSNIDKN